MFKQAKAAGITTASKEIKGIIPEKRRIKAKCQQRCGLTRRRCSSCLCPYRQKTVVLELLRDQETPSWWSRPRPRPRPTSLPGSPGSAGCYPLAAVTMRVAILAQLVGPVLARSLVGRESLRAASVDGASHGHLLEVPLSVLQPASSRYRSSEPPVCPRCRPAALWKSHWLSTRLS